MDIEAVVEIPRGSRNKYEMDQATSYQELEPGKGTDVRGWQDRASAEQVIGAAFNQASGSAAGLGEARSVRGRPSARRPAITTADELLAKDVGAAALLRLSMGGRIVN